jgi:hypothetical protein
LNEADFFSDFGAFGFSGMFRECRFFTGRFLCRGGGGLRSAAGFNGCCGFRFKGRGAFGGSGFRGGWRGGLLLDGFGDQNDGSVGGGFGRLGFIGWRRAAEVLFEVFRGDFIEGTGRDFGSGDAQFFGFRQNLLVLDTEFLCDVVNPNGHIMIFRPGWSDRVS